ncbi:MAG TPA: hypothetical protein DD638_01600 [Pasteurellaceae bacterium]|nr:hypothetical protein [Pasteurellaceae bacterium]
MEICYQITAQQYIAATRLLFSRQLQKSPQFNVYHVVRYSVIFLFSIGVFTYILQSKADLSLLLLLSCVLIIVLFMGCVPHWLAKMYHKQIFNNENRLTNMPCSVRIDENALIATSGEQYTVTPYSYIRDVLQDTNCFFIYIDTHSAIVIPLTAFRDKFECLEFENLLKNKIAQNESLSG